MSLASRFVRALLVASLASTVAACGSDGGSTPDSDDENVGTATDGEDGSSSDGQNGDGSPGDGAPGNGGQGGDGTQDDDAGAGGDGADGDGSAFDDGVLDGANGGSGTLNGMTYTYGENVSWFDMGNGTGNFSAYKGLLENWEIYGIPTTPGTYSCNAKGALPRIRLIMGNQYNTTEMGSCTLQVVTATADTVEGYFTAELWTSFPPQTLVGNVTEGVFRKAP